MFNESRNEATEELYQDRLSKGLFYLDRDLCISHDGKWRVNIYYHRSYAKTLAFDTEEAIEKFIEKYGSGYASYIKFAKERDYNIMEELLKCVKKNLEESNTCDEEFILRLPKGRNKKKLIVDDYARCKHCGHTWTAVYDFGSSWVYKCCPQCHLFLEGDYVI